MQNKRRSLLILVLVCLMIMPDSCFAAKKVKLSKYKITTYPGFEEQLVLKSYKGKKVKWSSTNKKVITVRRKKKNKCTLIAHTPGKAIVKVKYGKKILKCKIKVIDAKASSTRKEIDSIPDRSEIQVSVTQ